MSLSTLTPTREWCVQTTSNGVTDDLTYGWVTLGEAHTERDRFLSHVLRSHSGSTVVFEDNFGTAIQVTYPDGRVRHIDMVRKEHRSMNLSSRMDRIRKSTHGGGASA